MFRLIAAIDEDGGMGKDGDLPWSIRNDLSFFRFMTFGETVVMGRKTFENTGNLPGRRMIVLSRQEGYDGGDYHARCRSSVKIYAPPQDVTWIGGGKDVYEQYMGEAEEVVLSRINGTYDCDLFFPMDALKEKYEMIGRFQAEGFQAERYKLKIS